MVFVCFLQLLLVSWVLIYISFFSFPKGERKKKRENDFCRSNQHLHTPFAVFFSPGNSYKSGAQNEQQGGR